MLQNCVSEKPKIEEAELNGNQQDDSGRVVCSFFVFSLSLQLILFLSLQLLAYTLSCDLHTTHFACMLRAHLCVRPRPVCLFAPRRPKPLGRRGNS